MNRAISILLGLTIAATLTAADHGHGHGDAHPGDPVDLGRVTIGAVSLAVTLLGEVEAGGEAIVALAVAAGESPAELRTWIGLRDGRGSVKALLAADDHGHYHGHLEVPDVLPEGSAVWVEVVTASGRERASVALPAAGPDRGGDGAGHDHAGHDHDHAGHEHEDHDH